jgi:DNA polymerase-1
VGLRVGGDDRARLENRVGEVAAPGLDLGGIVNRIRLTGGDTVPRVTAPLLAVDAPSMLFRAFYALPKTITGADGEPVNALLGTANLVLREVERFEPRAVVLCFGPDAAEYRVELYPGYHADRPEVPEELAPQFAACRDFFEAFGWIVANHETLEADDLLGSYARVEAEAGGRALVLTGDRDMYQCAADQVTVLYVRTGGNGAEEVTPDEVRRRYGIPPELVPDFIALRGDPSDGLPGAKGVGEKTAAELLREHGSLEALLENALRISRPKLRTTLLESREELLAFKEIATLQDAGVERPPDRPTDWAGAAAAARERGMNRLADRLAQLAE